MSPFREDHGFVGPVLTACRGWPSCRRIAPDGMAWKEGMAWHDCMEAPTGFNLTCQMREHFKDLQNNAKLTNASRNQINKSLSQVNHVPNNAHSTKPTWGCCKRI